MDIYYFNSQLPCDNWVVSCLQYCCASVGQSHSSLTSTGNFLTTMPTMARRGCDMTLYTVLKNQRLHDCAGLSASGYFRPITQRTRCLLISVKVLGLALRWWHELCSTEIMISESLPILCVTFKTTLTYFSFLKIKALVHWTWDQTTQPFLMVTASNWRQEGPQSHLSFLKVALVYINTANRHDSLLLVL